MLFIISYLSLIQLQNVTIKVRVMRRKMMRKTLSRDVKEILEVHCLHYIKIWLC